MAALQWRDPRPQRQGLREADDHEGLEDALQGIGIEKALCGSFFHFQTISDGLYGPITDKLDIMSGGRTIADLIAMADGKKRRGKATPEISG